jgi:hypothetical protein
LRDYPCQSDRACSAAMTVKYPDVLDSPDQSAFVEDLR